MPRVRIAAAVVAALLAGAGAAAAEPEQVRLDDRGDACALDGLGGEVAALVGYDPFDADAARTVAITTTADDAGVIAEVTVGDEAARVVRAADCDELVRSLAVVVVLVLRVTPAVEPVAPVEPAPSQPELRATPRVTASIVIPSRPRRHAVELALVTGAAGSAPAWTPELTVGVRASRGRARTGVELAVRAPDDIAIAGGGSIAVSSARGSWLGCYRGPVDLCAVVAGGAIRGSGDRAASTPFAAVGGRVVWERRISRRLSLQLHGEVRGALTTTRFTVDAMPVWTSPRVEASAGAGVVAHIP